MKTNPSVFDIFQHNENFFDKLDDESFARKIVLQQILVIFSFSLIYGCIMGSYNGFLQSLVTALKMPGLLFLSLIICFPALFVIQYMIGSTMTLLQMTNVILSGFTVFVTIAISFSPIVIFFMITSENYAFLKLLHVAIFSFSGIFTIRTIINGLTYSCEKKNIYPKIGMSVFKIWIFIFAFVSSQLAWNLRPFVGSKDMPFELFREKGSNFYIAVIQSAADMFNPEKENGQNMASDIHNEQKGTTENNQQNDSTINSRNGQ